MALDVEAPKQNTPPVSSQPSGDKGKNVAIGVIVVLVILVVLAAVWFTLRSLNSTTETTTPAATQSQDVPVIKDDKDLEKLENELKNTDIDSVGNDLDANDTDAADF